MAAKIGKAKKQKRAVKKEVEIPVRVVGKNSAKNFFGSDENRCLSGSSQNVRLAVNDEGGLPHLETDFFLNNNKKLPAAASEPEKKQNLNPPLEEKKSKILKQFEDKEVKHSLPPFLKEKILWASVAILASLVFFVWLAIIKINFSLRLNNFFDAKNTGSELQDLRGEWSNLREQWSNLENIVEQKTAASANQQIINKLKEKILVEEIKNKVEQQ